MLIRERVKERRGRERESGRDRERDGWRDAQTERLKVAKMKKTTRASGRKGVMEDIQNKASAARTRAAQPGKENTVRGVGELRHLAALSDLHHGELLGHPLK